MIQYRTIQPVSIPKGFVVELTNDQAMPRLHNLKPRKSGQYEVKTEIRLKAGEIIGINPIDTTRAFMAGFEKIAEKENRKR